MKLNWKIRATTHRRDTTHKYSKHKEKRSLSKNIIQAFEMKNGRRIVSPVREDEIQKSLLPPRIYMYV